MKKKLFSVVSLILLLHMISCEKVDFVVTKFESMTSVFWGNIQQEGTKTYIDKIHNVRWQKEDKVSVFMHSTVPSVYQIDNSADGKTYGKFNLVKNLEENSFIAGTEISSIIAYYPSTNL